MTGETDRAHDVPPRAAPPPQGDYVPAVVYGGLAFSAGMTPRSGGRLRVRGRVGEDVGTREAGQAAALSAANALLALAEAAGGLDRIERCLRLTVYVACAEDFTEHSAVADGASRTLRGWLGERGAVARTAVGVRCLPSGAAVEVDLTVAVR